MLQLTIVNDLVRFYLLRECQIQTIQNRTVWKFKPKLFKPNRYKKLKLKPNDIRDFQTIKTLQPRFHSSVLVVKLGQFLIFNLKC